MNAGHGRGALVSTTLSASIALSIVLWGSAGFAATVTLVPVKDNTIYQGSDPVTEEDFEVNSCGAGSNLFSGVTADGLLRRALLAFDVAGSIPAGATIDSVALSLRVNRSADNQDAAMTLHRLDADWGEGTADCDTARGGGTGVPAAGGDATWRHSFFPDALWATPGGDFGAASASALVGFGQGDVGSWSAPGLVADVQAWLDDPTTNAGWILVGDEARVATARRFDSREGGTPPTLTVEFTPIGDVFACCFGDGLCNVLDTASCTAQGGTPFTDFATCDPNPCPQPTGACCNRDESCSDSVDRLVCEDGGGVFQGEGSACSDNRVDCGLEPFVDPLPLPGALQRASTRPDGTPVYELRVEATRQRLHRDLPATDLWGYNGLYPGPTIEASVGQPIEVKYVNALRAKGRRGRHLFEVDTCPHGPNYWRDLPRTVTHLHGGHVPARFDGQPEHDLKPGEFDVYRYPNDQLPATLWYHDHALGITRLNVYAGLAGFYLLRDAVESALGLPSGEFEVPIVIQDRSFFDNGELFYPPKVVNRFLGDKAVVNGKVWPYLAVKRGKYRLRLLNGSQARTYQLRLEELGDPTRTIPFHLIGTDGGLIDAPLPLDTLRMASGERLDVVVDFATLSAGAEVVLRNDDADAPLLPNVMKFVVTDQAGFTEALPETLRPVPPIAHDEQTPVRKFLLERVDEPCSGREWLIKSLDDQGNVIGSHWDDITEFPLKDSTEIWEFDNVSNEMHPMHVHLVMFQVIGRLDRNTLEALPLEPWEDTTWKDTVRALPGTITRVVATFEDYVGKFPYHCHILDHEDHEMMRQFQTTNDPARCVVDGICGVDEDCVSCPQDCGEVSGAFCGNGLCEAGDGEDCLSCPQDCAGKQKGKRPFCCGDGDGEGPIPACGLGADGFTIVDDRCTSDGFFCRASPRVLACCGDALCEGQEQAVGSAAFCQADCVDPALDCPRYPDRTSCRAQPSCRWDSQNRTCVAN